jgi:sugar phosphate isomerase/epimerase
LKLGLCTWFSDEIALEEIIPLASRLGYQGIEIAGFADELDAERRALLRGSLEANHMDVASISAAVPFARNQHALNLHSVDPETRDRSVGFVCDCVDLAVDLRCPLVYVASVARGPAGEPNPRDLMSDGLRVCADYARGKGVRLAIEHFPTGELPTLKDCIDLVSAIGEPNLGVLVDAGHLPLTHEPMEVPTAARGLVMHAHINNNDGLNDSHWPPATGKASKDDYVRFVRGLRALGYDGYLSLEVATLESIEPTLRSSRDFMLDLMKNT